MEGLLRVREILKEKNITSEKLAERIGVTSVTVSRIISGKSGTNLNTLVEIAKALDVEVKDLFVSKDELPLYVRKGDTFERVGSLKSQP